MNSMAGMTQTTPSNLTANRNIAGIVFVQEILLRVRSPNSLVRIIVISVLPIFASLRKGEPPHQYDA